MSVLEPAGIQFLAVASLYPDRAALAEEVLSTRVKTDRGKVDAHKYLAKFQFFKKLMTRCAGRLNSGAGHFGSSDHLQNLDFVFEEYDKSNN